MPRRSQPGVIRPLVDIASAVAIGVGARQRGHAVDERIRARVSSARQPTLDRVMPVVTDLGSVYAVSGAAAALWLGGRKRLARDLFGASMLAWVIAQAAKKGFRRTRPYHAGDVELLVREPAGTSYPSGHPAVAAAVAAVAAPELPAVVRAPLEAMPRVVGFSRVYVGVHYPSDVLGGILLGRAVGTLWRRFARY